MGFLVCDEFSFCCVFWHALPRAQHLPEYMSHCEWAYSKYGLKASVWLGSRDHIEMWEERFFHSQKASSVKVKEELEEEVAKAKDLCLFCHNF